MRASFRLGRIGGVDVGVHWSVLLIVALLSWSLGARLLPDTAPGYPTWQYWIAAVVTAVAFAGSILAHELSHAVVANRDGVPVESIVLWLFGGLAKLQSHARSARSELRIAVAGPAMSLLIGIASLVAAAALHVAGALDLLGAALSWLGGINVLLALFNMLPGAPLDGGRVLAAVLWYRWGDQQRARRSAAAAGRILGQVLVALGVVEFAFVGVAGLWTALVGWLIVSMARMEMNESDLRQAFADIRVRDVMTTEPVVLDARLTVEEFVHRSWPGHHVSSFPVVDEDGRLLGVVTPKHVGSIPPDRWHATPITTVATPIDQLVTAGPDDPLLDVLATKRDVNARVLVLSGGRLVGIVSPSDVASAFERLSLVRDPLRTRLGPPPDGWATPRGRPVDRR
ncbi:MAG: site-2 protease family protein [Ilumatobacteraceae bacterium]